MAAIVRSADVEDAPGIARVHVESWRATYAGILSQGYLEGLSVGDRERHWREILGGEARSRTCVAEASGGGIFGFSSAGPERSSESPGWELYAIYLLQSWQGAGLGRRLFAGALETAGTETPVITWCISENPSRRFYESLGGKPLKTQMTEIGGVSLEERRYVWTDVQELRSRLIANT